MDGDLGKGWFFSPTVFADATPDMRIAREEIFGPVTTVVPVESFEEGPHRELRRVRPLGVGVHARRRSTRFERCGSSKPGSST